MPTQDQTIDSIDEVKLFFQVLIHEDWFYFLSNFKKNNQKALERIDPKTILESADMTEIYMTVSSAKNKIDAIEKLARHYKCTFETISDAYCYVAYILWTLH